MKHRGLRRANTKKYQNKQIRLYSSYFGELDTSEQQTGRWRQHSWKDGGGCECCKNPRNSIFLSQEEQLTIQERKATDNFQDYLEVQFDT